MLAYMGNNNNSSNSIFEPVNFRDESLPTATAIPVTDNMNEDNGIIMIDTSNLEGNGYIDSDGSGSSDINQYELNDILRLTNSDSEESNDIKDVDLTERKKVRGLCGFQNLGNTCFMNSILQCLMSNSLLVSIFLSKSFITSLEENMIKKIYKTYKIDTSSKINIKQEGFDKIMHDTITMDFYKIVEGYYYRNRTIIPKSFKERMGKERSCFKGYSQHDSEEALSMILDKIHEELVTTNNIKFRYISTGAINYLIVNKKFREFIKNDSIDIEVKKKITRMYIYYNRQNIDDFISLKAHIYWRKIIGKENSIIQDLFTGLFVSTVCCTVCGNKSGSFEPFNTLSLPIPSNSDSTLKDCLSNFSKEEILNGDNKWDCNVCKKKVKAFKIVTIFKLPQLLTIHFKRFKGIQIFTKISSNILFPLEEISLKNSLRSSLCENYERDKNIVYNVYGISCHIGGVNSGHYIAYCKNIINNQWYKFDDKDIYCRDKESVKKNTSSAYVIFLEQKKVEH